MLRLRVGVHQVADLVVGAVYGGIDDELDVALGKGGDEAADDGDYRVLARGYGEDDLVLGVILDAEGGEVLEAVAVHAAHRLKDGDRRRVIG